MLASPQGVRVRVGGREFLSFCSNDYLGLAAHPRVVEALREAAARHGVGAGASHLVCGHHAAHHALEEELAAFLGAPRALLFSTGYQANLGVAAALLDRHAHVFEDRLNHASLIDAVRLARARSTRYPHLDAAHLAQALADSDADTKLVASDGVFSMDGDVAPLPALLAAAARVQALVLIDEAHALGVLGVNGRGSFEHFGIAAPAYALRMGTLGKAFGTFGAFVAGDAVLIETLIQHARTYIYTTALPPAVAEATRAALALVCAEPERRTHLRALIERLRHGARARGLTLADSITPIQPLIVGEATRALALASALRARGLLVPAIRPPAVPAGQARLRISLSAAHTLDDVERLLDALDRLRGAA